MHFRYQTAIATLIQFITLTVLGFANGVDSVVTTCHNSSGDCVSNMLVSMIFFILTALWFAAVWILGSAAQERRNKRLAQALIAAEVLIALVAAFNAKHHTDWLGLITSLIDIALAIWVITLAYRLMCSNGGRVVAKPRTRHRVTPTKDI